MSDELFDRFTKCAVEVLSADSLDLVELVMALEEEFDVTIDEEELQGVTTVGGAYDLLSSKIS